MEHEAGTLHEIGLPSIRPIGIKESVHAGCVVCSPENKRGLRLEFVLCEDGSVCADFRYPKTLQGYEGFLHGGVISSLLDGAMTNCLFAHGRIAFTAELNVRFLRPVVIGKVGTVQAWIDRPHSILNVLKAEVIQGGQVMATAVGKFMERHRQTGGAHF